MKQHIEEILRHRKKEKISSANLRSSAVLMPLFYDQGQYYILLTERSDQVNFHKGQVCFPGGTQQPSDSSLRQTALRETEEEIGLKTEDIEILGELDDSVALSSNCVISPFVAFIPYPYTLRIDGREVKGTFSVPLSFFMDEANFKDDHYAYEYAGHIIWGATARIVRHFIGLLRSESGGR